MIEVKAVLKYKYITVSVKKINTNNQYNYGRTGINFLNSLRTLRLNGQQLKMIAAVTMFIDHLTCCFLEVARGADGRSLMYTFQGGELLDQIGRSIGRIAFPIFCFFLVEGYIWTRDKGKYLSRLLLFGLLSHFPFNWIFFPNSTNRHTDTLFTLALGFLAIWGIDIIAQNLLPAKYRPITNGALRSNEDTSYRDNEDKYCVWKSFAALVLMILWTGMMCYASYYLGTDYRYGGVLTIVIFYVFYRKRELGLSSGYLWLSYYNGAELMSLPAFALLYIYNGRRGKQNKYLFYLFYPVHLLVLYLIRRAIFGG